MVPPSAPDQPPRHGRCGACSALWPAASARVCICLRFQKVEVIVIVKVLTTDNKKEVVVNVKLTTDNKKEYVQRANVFVVMLVTLIGVSR